MLQKIYISYKKRVAYNSFVVVVVFLNSTTLSNIDNLKKKLYLEHLISILE